MKEMDGNCYQLVFEMMQICNEIERKKMLVFFGREKCIKDQNQVKIE